MGIGILFGGVPTIWHYFNQPVGKPSIQEVA